MGAPAKRKFAIKLSQDCRIRYSVLAIGGLTILSGIGLTIASGISGLAFNSIVFYGMTMPPFLVIVGGLICISALLQVVTYDLPGRRPPAQKIGRPFDATDAEITEEYNE